MPAELASDPGISKRNVRLNKAAIKVAKDLGPVDYNDDDGSTRCEPFDVLKHLTSDYLRKKLGT